MNYTMFFSETVLIVIYNFMFQKNVISLFWITFSRIFDKQERREVGRLFCTSCFFPNSRIGMNLAVLNISGNISDSRASSK